MCEKWPNLPKASVSQNSRSRMIIFFQVFGFIFSGLFMGFVSQNVFLSQITWTLSYVLGIYHLDEYFLSKKIQTHNIKEFWKTLGILLPSVYGSTLKNLTLTFCPKSFFLTSIHRKSKKTEWDKNQVNFSRWHRTCQSQEPKKRHFAIFSPRKGQWCPQKNHLIFRLNNNWLEKKCSWTNQGWDMISLHKNFGCCFMGHLYIWTKMNN